MTGLLHEKEFSRKNFLKGGGAMLVGFSVLGAGIGAKAAKAADDPYASNGPYDQTAVDSWLIIHSDNTASLKIGKVEMGQGTPTALLIIAAEELNLDFKQMKMITHDTNITPNQGASVRASGSAGAAPSCNVPYDSTVTARPVVSRRRKTSAKGLRKRLPLQTKTSVN